MVRNYAFLSAAVLTLLAVGCASEKSESSASSNMALVNDLTCNISRGAFVSTQMAAADGSIKVACPGTANVTFNNQPIKGDSSAFTVKPQVGVNIIHIESPTPDNSGNVPAQEIAFLYGSFADARTVTGKALSIHIGAPGLSAASLPALPLPAGPTNVTLSQIGTQILRDQGNIVGRLDGTSKDVSGAGFGAGITVVHSSYDPDTATVRLSARDGGLHLEVDLNDIQSQMNWEAHAPLGIEYDDTLDVMVGQVQLQADIDLAYNPTTKAISAQLGGHNVHLSGVDLDDEGLSRIPIIGGGLNDAISAGAEFLINHFGDDLLSSVQDQLLPKLSMSLDQFHLPQTLDVPFLGGQVDMKENIDGATFLASGSEVSIAAGVLAPTGSQTIPNPGFLTLPAQGAAWDNSQEFGASLSLDFINQAFYSVWSQGLLNRKLIDGVNQLGISTGPIVSDLKLPPVIMASTDGQGLVINMGELELDTVYHSQSNGDAKVRMAVSLVTKANIAFTADGSALQITPGGDEQGTQLSARLIAVEDGKQAAADELSSMLNMFVPYLQTLIADDINLPPVAIPSVDLGLLSPEFSGRMGRFNGQLHFDSNASRIVLEGNLVAQ